MSEQSTRLYGDHHKKLLDHFNVVFHPGHLHVAAHLFQKEGPRTEKTHAIVFGDDHAAACKEACKLLPMGGHEQKVKDLTKQNIELRTEVDTQAELIKEANEQIMNLTAEVEELSKKKEKGKKPEPKADAGKTGDNNEGGGKSPKPAPTPAK